jgi:hypothetical protein
MKRALAASVVVCAALAASGASASPDGGPTPGAAAVAFGDLLHHLYGVIYGYWTCPAAAEVDGRIDCLAEVHRGRDWHEVAVSARIRNGVIVLTTLSSHAARRGSDAGRPTPGISSSATTSPRRASHP